MYHLTIDMGTTNTRVTLWDIDKNIIDSQSAEVGVRNTAFDNNNNKIKEYLHKGIISILENNNLVLDNVDSIIASGMITSNIGIVEMNHLKTPAGIGELANDVEKFYFPEIVDKYIHFIPGVKNSIHPITLNNVEDMDMMRGEETEVIGFMNRIAIKVPSLIVIPGSHNKFIFIDEINRISSCITTLSGELISTITSNTIISDALNGSFAKEISKDMVIKGYRLCEKVGLNRSVFSLRILDQFTDYSENEKANMLLGIVLYEDIKAVLNSDFMNSTTILDVYVCGRDILKDALTLLFKEDGSFKNIYPVESDKLLDLSGYGALYILDKHKELKGNKR